MADMADVTGAAPRALRDTLDVETARRFYADLLIFEARMEAAGEGMRNRGHWLRAQRRLYEAREDLEHFIGERLTKDLREAAVVAERSAADAVARAGREG